MTERYSRQSARIYRQTRALELRTLLREVLDAKDPALLALLRSMANSRVESDTATVIVESLQDELQRTGFDDDWKPTARGLMLEYLIDHWHEVAIES